MSTVDRFCFVFRCLLNDKAQKVMAILDAILSLILRFRLQVHCAHLTFFRLRLSD